MIAQRPRVLYTGTTLSDSSRAAFAEAGLEPVVAPRDLTPDALTTALHHCDAYVLAGLEKATEPVIRTAARLRVIAFMGVGYANFVDAAMAARHGVAVTNAPGDNAMAVAEFTVALALEATRHAARTAAAVKRGRWTEEIQQGLIGRTVGVVGCGAIGSAFARMVHTAFGCRILYCNRTQKRGLEEQTGAIRVDLLSLMRESDIVSLHVASTPETEGMIGATELAMIKPGAALICTARAELIQPRPLRRALETGRISCAAMDGYYQGVTPSPDQDPHLLLAMDNMMVTPHVAYLTQSALDAALRTNLASINNILRSGTDRFLVNPEYKAFLDSPP